MLFDIKNIPANITAIKPLSYKAIKFKSKPLKNIPSSAISRTKEIIYKAPDGLEKVIWQMVATCQKYDGVGLAAPQIGIFKRLFIIAEMPGEYKAYIHSQYKVSPEAILTTELEGCLSVPGINVSVTRPSIIIASWLELSEDNKELMWKENKVLTEPLSRIFQHENDHCLQRTVLDYK